MDHKPFATTRETLGYIRSVGSFAVDFERDRGESNAQLRVCPKSVYMKKQALELS